MGGNESLIEALNAGDIDRAFAVIERDLTGDVARDRRFALLVMRARLRMVVDDPGLVFPDLDTALGLASSVEQQSSVLLARAEAFEAIGDHDAARQDLERLLASGEDVADLASVEQNLGRIERDHGDLGRGIQLLESARNRLIRASSEQDRMAEASLDLAMALRLAGNLERSIALLEEIVSTADPALALRILIQIGTTHGFAGAHDQALSAWDRALHALDDPTDRAVVRYNRAVTYRELRDLDSAREELQRALVDNAGLSRRVDLDALLLLGIVEREAQDFQRSLVALAEAAQLAPEGDPHGRVRLEVGTTMATAGMFGPAIEELAAAIATLETPSDRARAYRYRGMARRELGLIEQALSDFDEAVELEPDPNERARGQVTRAMLLLGRDRRSEALAVVQEAMDSATDPDVVLQVIVQRGALLAATGDLDAAIDDLERGLSLATDLEDTDTLARVLVDLGTIYETVGRPDEATMGYEQAAALTRSGPIAHAALMNLGRWCVTDRRPIASLEAFERAAGAAEDDRDARASAFLSRGNAALRFQRFGQASGDFERVLTLQPSRELQDQAETGLRTTRHHLDHISEMRDELTRLGRAPEEPSFRAGPMLQRGVLAMQSGDSDAAIVDITRAIALYQLRPDKALAHAHLALVHAHRGDCDSAGEHLQGADDLDPERAWRHQLRDEPDWRNCIASSWFGDFFGPQG